MSPDRVAAVRLRGATEWLLAALVVAGAIHAAWRLARDGYLPQPFLYNPDDTFMDWYYTAYWARDGGAYRIWHSMYPPLSFVWTRIFSTPACYRVADTAIRDCDPIGRWVLVTFWATNGALAWAAFRRHRVAAMPRALALAFGLPALFALERGQLITPALTFFILGWSALLARGVPRAVALALALNFKPYLLPTMFGLLPRRRWAVLVLVGWASLLVYVACWGMAGGSPFEIIANYGLFARLGQSFPVTEVYQATSFGAFAGVLGHGVPAGLWAGGGLGEVLAIGRRVLTGARTAQAVVEALLALAMVGAMVRPRALEPARCALLAILMVFIATSPGVYGLGFVLFLLFLEPAAGAAIMTALVCGYLISVPFDWIIVPYPTTAAPAWLTGRIVEARFGLAVGQLARPALLLVMGGAIAWDSLARIRRADA